MSNPRPDFQRWTDEDGNNFVRWNIGRSSLVLTGDVEGIEIQRLTEEVDRKTYSATFTVTSKTGHVFTLEDGKEYTTMPGDTLNIALPMSPLTKQPRPFEYILRAESIKSRVERTKKSKVTRTQTSSAWIPPMSMISSFSLPELKFDDWEKWATGGIPTNPFEGFKPTKGKKKEKGPTAEEMEKTLTEIGKRKIDMK